MKKVISLFVMVIFIVNLKAQRICPLDEQLGLLYIKNGAKVSINTQYVSGIDSGMRQIYEYIMENDSIKSRYLSYNPDEPVDTTFIAGIDYFPGGLRIKNNFFELTYLDESVAMSVGIKKDSIVFDEKGNVKEHYLKIPDYPYIILSSKLLYLNDTVIVEIDPGWSNPYATVYKYELDSEYNLKSVWEASVDKQKINVDSLDYTSMAYDALTTFNYDKKMARVEDIRYYINENVEGVMKLLTTQCFKYKKGCPVSSQVKDEKTGKIIYRQKYKYTSIRQ